MKMESVKCATILSYIWHGGHGHTNAVCLYTNDIDKKVECECD